MISDAKPQHVHHLAGAYVRLPSRYVFVVDDETVYVRSRRRGRCSEYTKLETLLAGVLPNRTIRCMSP